MAKQLINVGSQANDGTGDSIRSGAQKVNSSITEIYNNLGNGTDLQVNITNTTSGNVLRSNGSQFVSALLDYGDLSGRPTIPDAQVSSDWNATSGVAQILNKPSLFSGVYEDLIDAPILSTVATTGSYSDLLNKPTLSTVATTGSYSDLLNKPTLFSGSYADLTNSPSLSNVATTGDYNDLLNLPDLQAIGGGAEFLDELTDVTITTPVTANVLRYDGGLELWVNSPLDYADLANTPDSLAPSRTTISATTSSISDGTSASVDLVGFKSYMLMKIETSHAAWVTVYTDSTSRTSDSSRPEYNDPIPGSGVIAEVISTGAETILLTPGTLGFNNDSTVSENIYLKVVNKSGSTAAIDVTLTLLQLEL